MEDFKKLYSKNAFDDDREDIYRHFIETRSKKSLKLSPFNMKAKKKRIQRKRRIKFLRFYQEKNI